MRVAVQGAESGVWRGHASELERGNAARGGVQCPYTNFKRALVFDGQYGTATIRATAKYASAIRPSADTSSTRSANRAAVPISNPSYLKNS